MNYGRVAERSSNPPLPAPGIGDVNDASPPSFFQSEYSQRISAVPFSKNTNSYAKTNVGPKI